MDPARKRVYLPVAGKKGDDLVEGTAFAGIEHLYILLLFPCSGQAFRVLSLITKAPQVSIGFHVHRF